MTSKSDINFGFLNQESDKIDVLEVVPDLTYDFHLESKYLVSIMKKLNDLSTENCILCQVKYIMVTNASVRLLFTKEYLQFTSDYKLQKIKVKNEYLLYGTLKQSISTLSPSFIHTLKENKMMGICCISVELLREKIETWISQKAELSSVITTNVDLANILLPNFDDEDLFKLRFVSRDAKKMIDLNRPMITFEQSELPHEFDYTPESFETLCHKFTRQPKDCALNIIYVIGLSVGDRKVIIKNVDTNEDEIITIDPTILAKSHIKLRLQLRCDNVNSPDIDITSIEIKNVIDSLCSIIGDLKGIIYSLDIDFDNISVIREDYKKFDKLLTEIPNLEILTLSYGSIRWKPFLECIKNIKTLKELDLTDIDMITNLTEDPVDGDPEPEEFDYQIFHDIFCDSLKHLQSIRIAGDDCIVTKDEQDHDDDEIRLLSTHLFDVLVNCLERFTNLKSLGFTYNKERILHFIDILPYINTGNITRLDLSESDLTEGVDKMTDIGILLMGLENLKELDLSACELYMMKNLRDKSLGPLLSLSDERGGNSVSMIDLLKRRKIAYIISDEDEDEDEDTVIFKRPEVVFEQSELPRDFLYLDESFKDLCVQTYGKKIKNYGLNVLFGIKFIVVKGKRILDIKAFDTEGNEIKVINSWFLTEPHIKLSIEIFCDNVNNTNADNMVIMHLISKIIENHSFNIYSLVIDFKGISIEREDYDKFDKVLRDIPNLTILKLSNGDIEWHPFLSGIKSIQKLEDLDLTNISMVTNNLSKKYNEDLSEDLSEFYRRNVPNFHVMFSDSLKHLKSIRIAGDNCVLDRGFSNYHLLLELANCVQSFTNLKSLGFTYNKERIGVIISQLHHIQNITRLDLSESDLMGDMDKMVDIGFLVMGLENLKELDLSACNLSVENLNNKSIGALLHLTDGRGGNAVSIIDLLKRRNITYGEDEDEDDDDEDDGEDDDEEDEEEDEDEEEE